MVRAYQEWEEAKERLPVGLVEGRAREIQHVLRDVLSPW